MGKNYLSAKSKYVYNKYMSKVVVVKYINSASPESLTKVQYGQLLSAGIRSVAGAKDINAAVRGLIPDGVVGMKVNCLARKANSTPVKLVEAMTQILTDAGRDDNDIVVWERTSREMKMAGFPLNAASSGCRFMGTDANAVGYSDDIYTSGEVNSRVSSILTDVVDSNINLALLKDHSIAGLSAGLKNMYGAIHNPNKYHDNNCDPFCADVSMLEPLRSKNRLTIIDAVRVQYDGGPGFVSQYIHNYGGLIISADPVAADRIGLEILERIRKRHEMRPLREVGRQVTYLDTAAKRGLGVADMSAIALEVINVNAGGRLSAGELI
jgi:uncharacterized protein (DUF362 family)